MSAEESRALSSTLRLTDLRTAINAALDQVEQDLGPAVDLAGVEHYNDYYWALAVDIAFAMDDDPGLRVSAGQTSDDLETLADLLEEPADQLWTHSLTHLAELLRLLVYVTNPRAATRHPDSDQPVDAR